MARKGIRTYLGESYFFEVCEHCGHNHRCVKTEAKNGETVTFERCDIVKVVDLSKLRPGDSGKPPKDAVKPDDELEVFWVGVQGRRTRLGIKTFDDAWTFFTSADNVTLVRRQPEL